MNIKYNILYLFAALTLVACNADDAGGGSAPVAYPETNIPLVFNTSVTPLSRATETGATAAKTLGGSFYVYGIKNEGSGTLDGNVVFNSYKVAYTDNTTGSSTTNSSGWEYVGVSKTDNEISHILVPVVDATTGGYTVSPTTATTQTVKYWDPSASNYTFYAFADAGKNLANGNITVTKTYTTSKTDRYNNGYTINIGTGADPTKLYFASRQYIVPSGNTDTQATNAYNGKVNFTFRNAMAKVRVGMYETIPGYSLTIDGFDVAEDEATPSFGDMTTQKTDKFAANFSNNTSADAGTMTVTYNGTIVDAELMPQQSETNEPSISFSSENKNNVLTLGPELKKGTELKTSAAEAVYDQSDKAYTTVYPQGDNKNTLKLKVDFTLKSAAGEPISVKGATAEVPAEYLQWKPGFAYTYLFKIGDKMNGAIGALTGLYPITLDAVAVSDGAGKEEVISTTSEANVNIVTVGYDPVEKKVTVGADAYNTGNRIYASVYDTDKTVTLSADNTKLYTVTTDDASNYPITAATVADYITAAATNSSLLNQHVTAWQETGSYESTVPGSNGTTYTLSAMSWIAENRVYAVEYTYTGSDSKTEKIYKIVKIDGNNGLTSGTLTLDRTALENVGGKIYPSLEVDGVKITNDNDIKYALDTEGKAGAAVPVTVTIEKDADGNTYINVPATTTPTDSGQAYHVTATYHGRTYTAAFTVK